MYIYMFIYDYIILFKCSDGVFNVIIISFIIHLMFLYFCFCPYHVFVSIFKLFEENPYIKPSMTNAF